MNNINTLIILGMHRSGTSVLTGCLNFLDVNLGNSMMPPNQSNPAGYWENNDIVSVHDILFRDLSHKWDRIGTLPEDWLATDAAVNAKQSIKKLIDIHYTGKGLWAVKDPRMCRLMPLWLTVLKELGCTPGFVITLRHPLEVAGSLTRRNNFSQRKGLLLWLIHNRDLFAACQGHPFSVHTYDQLLADPVSTLQGIEQDLGIVFPKPIQAAYPNLLNFIQPGLRTQHAGQSSYEKLDPASAERSAENFLEKKLYSELYEHVLQKNIYLKKQNNDPNVSMPEFPFLRNQRAGHIYHKQICSLPAFEHSCLFDQLLAQTGEFERTWNSHSLHKERKVLGSASPLMAQLLFPQAREPVYNKENCKTFFLLANQWQEIICSIPDPGLINSKALRFDPLTSPGIVQLSSLRLVNLATGECLLSVEHPEQFAALEAANHSFILQDQENFTLVSTGHDPQLYFPLLPMAQDCPLELRVWIKATNNLEVLRNSWEQMQDESNKAKSRVDHMEARLSADQAQHEAEMLNIKALLETEQAASKESEKKQTPDFKTNFITCLETLPQDDGLLATAVFNLLTSLGLRPDHRLLDIGCGALHLGRLLIPYLNAGNYVGLEPNQWMAEQNIRRVMGHEILSIKKADLIYKNDLQDISEPLQLDFEVAYSFFLHCGRELIGRWFKQLSFHLKDTGALIAAFKIDNLDSQDQGWVYPDYVSYRKETISAIAAENNFTPTWLESKNCSQHWAIFAKKEFPV